MHPPLSRMFLSTPNRQHLPTPLLLLLLLLPAAPTPVWPSAPSRPLTAPDIDYGAHHPWQRHSQRSLATTTALSSNDALYQPLRLAFDSTHLRAHMELALRANDSLAATQLYLLLYEVLPATAAVWGDVLRVIPVLGGIYPLDARGGSKDVWLSTTEAANGTEECSGGPCRGYQEDPVRRLYCPDETTAGIGEGADLLVYATVNRHCEETNLERGRRRTSGAMGTLASALSCQRDQYDRPITGSIDFCLSGMGDVTDINVVEFIAQREASQDYTSAQATDKWTGWNHGNEATYSWSRYEGKTDQDGNGNESSNSTLALDERNSATVQYSIGVAIHEIGHVLGVTSDSLSYFRHPLTGNPLTPRPFTLSIVTCVSGEEIAYVGMPGPNVMRQGTDKGTGARYFEVITPTVKRIVRNQFNCPNATGARLENQFTSKDCFGSHWDERLFFTEIMGPVFSETVNVLSPLTLALLEDSGWYRANYQSKYVQLSTFGLGAGCEFIDEKCLDSNGQVPSYMEEQFCNDVIEISPSGDIYADRAQQTCDPSHVSKTYCDLVNTNELIGIGKTAVLLEPPPSQFQYFQESPSIRPYIFTSADYCPIPHLDPQSCTVYRGQTVLDEQWEAGEIYSVDSRCVETDGSRSYSLCLETKCNLRLGLVQIIASGKRWTCEYDGQVHTMPLNDNQSDSLRIKCPKAALVCPSLFCPVNCAGRGDCVYRPKDTISTSEPAAKCVCDSESDRSAGCFQTELAFSEISGNNYENPDRADKAIFLLIVGSLVMGLAAVFVVVRQWKARQNVFM